MSVETRVNVPLLRKAVEWVEEQEALPESVRVWDQSAWSCETGKCVAGYVCSLDGWKGTTFGIVERDGREEQAWRVAADLLGIPNNYLTSRGEHLFGGGNTAADIRRIAEELAGERL